MQPTMPQNDNNHIFQFVIIFIGIFAGSLFIFSLVGLAPEGWRITNWAFGKKEPNFFLAEENIITIREYKEEKHTRPDRIIISKIGVDTRIEQPETRDVTELDKYLEKGAVHYPGSGSIEKGNMFVFGHSADLYTYVSNSAYRAFDGVSKLKSGDEIEVIADGETYIYKVRSVKLVDQNNALIKFDNSRRSLTISTCNTFGSREERWVVEADFYE